MNADDKSDAKRVLIVGDDCQTIVHKARSLGVTTFVAARWKDKQRELAKEIAEIESTQRIHESGVRMGRPVPILTTLAAKFPLLSRRQRRAMQRAISKQADKERG